MHRLTLIFGCVVFLGSASSGGALTVKFKFAKSPPSVALVYFHEENLTDNPPCPIVDQRDKRFVNKLFVGRTGCQILFKNSDSVDHNIYSKDAKAGVDFDAGLLSPGKTTQLAMGWKPDAVIKIGCKIHPKMQAYIANVSTTHFKIIEFRPALRESTITLNSVPDKLSNVRIWFPKQDQLSGEIKKKESKRWEIHEKGRSTGVVFLSRK